MPRHGVCRIVIIVYAVLFLLALGVAVVGTQGLFGTQPDGLAAVWLIFLGMPWTSALSLMIVAGLPVFIGQLVAVLAPILNIFLIRKLCQRRKS